MKSTFVDAGLAIAAGDSAPPGATVAAGGVNFSVFSKDADLVERLLFDDPQATEAAETIPLDPRAHRTYHYWHAFVPGLGAGQVYAYRAHGPFAPERGLRFDSDKVLLDPYGLAVAVHASYTRTAASRPGVSLEAPNWNDYSHSLAFTIEGRHGRIRLHGILNAYWVPLEHAPLVTASTIVAQPRSIVVLAQVVHDVLGAPR